MRLADAPQRDDPGIMVNMGYTAGAMNDRMLASARNRLNRNEANNEGNEQQDLEDGSWMALLWNVMLKSLPRIITASYDERIAELGLPRMPTFQENEYEVKLGNKRYQFTEGDLAPPAAVTAWNYQR